MASGFWTWLTGSNGGPGGNATADATINWAEGQSPSSINDSARAMMSRLAEYRDDVSGLLLTGGTSTAYTITTNQGFASTPNDGQLIAFTPNATNGAGVTLQADGGNTYPIQTAPGVAVGNGVLILGTPYVAKFSVSASAWILRDYYSLTTGQVPIGGYIAYDAATSPNSNFILPYGQAISRTTYATYFSLVGTRFGPGDGSTTFNVRDCRGGAFFCLDNLGGTPANKITSGGSGIAGTTLGASGGAETVTLTTNQMPSHNHAVYDPEHAHSYTYPAQTTISGTGIEQPLGAAANTTGYSATGIGLYNTGGGAAHNNMPPALIAGYILRVL